MRYRHFPYGSLTEFQVLRALFARDRAKLTDWFAQKYQGRAFAYCSGRASLRALLKAANLAQGDEVIVCGFTCLAVPEAVIYAGAIPVYADLAPADWSSGVEQILRVSTNRTRAVIVQHTFGLPAPIKEIALAARQRGWLVIEDCALALGSETRDAPLGVAGDAAIFSFEMTKTIAAGWGGMAVVRHPGMIAGVEASYLAEPEIGAIQLVREIAQILISTLLFRPVIFGFSKYFVAVLYRSRIFRMSGKPLASRTPRGWSYKLPQAHASIAFRQIKHLERIRLRAAEIVGSYRQWLDERKRVDVSGPRDDGVRFLRFPLLVAAPEQLVTLMSRNGFELGRWFDTPISPMPDPPKFVHYSWGACPRAEYVAKHVVNLPVNLRLTNADVQKLLALLDASNVECMSLPN